MFVANAYSKEFLKNFEEVLNVYIEQLEEHQIVHGYVSSL